MNQLTNVRRKAGRIGGIVTASLHPKDRNFLARIGKQGGRPRRKSYSEIVNGGAH